MTPELTIDQLKEVLASDGYEEGGDAYESALVVASAYIVGADAERVGGYTGLPNDVVLPIAQRLVENGVWENGKVCVEEEPGDGVEFAMQVAVGRGYLERTTDSQTEVSGGNE